MSTEKKNSPANNFSITSHSRPYPGLRPFYENEPDLFFGRDKQVNDIIGRLSKNNVAAILGGSGCGKSSLVRAGVIPVLRSYGIPNRSDTWVPVTFTPGVAPIENLALELNRSLTPIGDDKEELTRKNNIRQTLRAPNALSSFFEEYKNQFNINNEAGLNLGEHANLLVLVDQFEEVFRPQNTAAVGQIQLLIKLITECFYNPHKQVFLILTMRSEYLERCANYPKFADVLNEVSFLTRRLEGDELIEVIIQPARRHAAKLVKPPVDTLENDDIWPFEEQVKTRLLRDVNALRDHDDTDHLPLLQHYLFWLWHTAYGRWERSGGTQKFNITQEDMVNAVGGKNPGSLLKDCLNNQAQNIFDSLTPNRQNTAEKMFRLLAELENNGKYTRRWTNIEDIFKLSTNKSEKPNPAEESEIREQIVKPFMSPHEYLRMEDKSDTDIDVAHEALIRNWGTFENWLKDEKVLRDAYMMLLKESKKPAKPRKHWFACSEDLLDIKQINFLKNYNIQNLGPIWAQRYHDVNLTPQEKNSINKPISSDYQKAVAYFKKSEDALICKKTRSALVYFILPILLFLLIIALGLNTIYNREINLFQPYAVANALKGSALEEPEKKRLIRFQQLAVALRAIEKLDKKEGWWKFVSFFVEWPELARLERLARSAVDSSVRFDFEALVPSTFSSKDYTSPPKNKKYIALDTPKECIKRIFNAPFFDQSRRYYIKEMKNSSWWSAPPTKGLNWSPILIELNSEYFFGVKKGNDNNNCEFLGRIPLPTNIDSLYHDDLLQLMIWNTVGSATINVARINWYYFLEHNTEYQFNFKSIGYIVDNPYEKNIELDKIKISPNVKGFSIVRDGEEKQYKIHVADSLEPVQQEDVEKVIQYFNPVHDKNYNNETNNNIDPCPTGTQPTNKDFFCSNTELSYQNKPIYIISDDEKDKFKFTNYAYSAIVDDDNKGYLAFTVALKDQQTSQTLTIYLFDKRLFNTNPDDVKIEIAKFAFRCPPVTKIAFGKGPDKGWLFFETESGQKDQKAYYRTAFGVEQLRVELCNIIKDYPDYIKDTLDIEHRKDSATSTYQVFDKNREGVVHTITEKGDECNSTEPKDRTN